MGQGLGVPLHRAGNGGVHHRLTAVVAVLGGIAHHRAWAALQQLASSVFIE